MSLQKKSIHTWDRTTPNDGILLNEEFSTIYKNFDKIENEDFTFNGDISVKKSLTVNNRNIPGSTLKKINSEDLDVVKYDCEEVGFFKVILRREYSEDENKVCYVYKTVDCGLYFKGLPNLTENDILEKTYKIFVDVDKTNQNKYIFSLKNITDSDQRLPQRIPGTFRRPAPSQKRPSKNHIFSEIKKNCQKLGLDFSQNENTIEVDYFVRSHQEKIYLSVRDQDLGELFLSRSYSGKTSNKNYFEVRKSSFKIHQIYKYIQY
jgi:hypothetical protein